MCVIATPQASQWIDRPALESLIGRVVRTEYKLPGESDPLPKADAMLLMLDALLQFCHAGDVDPLSKANAMLVMPATFNTINKWAQGIGDTLVASILCEALGRGTTPILAVPCLKMDLVRHPAFKKSIALLREYGVRILHEPERYPSPLMVPWNQIFEALSEMTEHKKEL